MRKAASGKGALAMASKVAANDAKQLREKSKNLSKSKADEEDEEQEEQEEDDDDDDSPSNSEVEGSSAQSSKAHALRKQVQQEELTLRQWEERLAELKKRNAKRNRAFVELQNSQNFDGEEEDQQPAPIQSKRTGGKVRKMKHGREDAAKVIWCHDVW